MTKENEWKTKVEKQKKLQPAVTLYRVVRDLTGSRNITSVTIKSRNGEVLLTEREQSSRWVEH